MLFYYILLTLPSTFVLPLTDADWVVFPSTNVSRIRTF